MDERCHLLTGKRPLMDVTLAKGDRESLLAMGVAATVGKKFFLAKRGNPSSQNYTCCETDLNKSVVSSFVAGLFKTGGNLANRLEDHFIFFGQVRYFLLCQTDSGSKAFAKVERKGAPLRDSEAPGLWRVQDVEHKTLFLFQNSPHH